MQVASSLSQYEESDTANELISVLAIMAGERNALLDASDSWYEMVIAQLLFIRPHKASKVHFTLVFPYLFSLMQSLTCSG